MNRKILFDRSVWIDFFTGKENKQSGLLTRYLKEDFPVYICPVIIQEILQGIGDDKQFESIRESLLALEIMEEDPVEAAIEAAIIYRRLRKNGITVRKSNDCLIAWHAIHYQMTVIHKDRDFDLIFDNLHLISM